MDWLQSLILGTVQGLAEYLPISSSGHLQIFQDILGLDLQGQDSLQFNVVLHVATVLSTIVVLWREFVPLCTSFFTLKRDDNTRYVFKILVSCIPIMVVGLFFKDSVEALFEGNLRIVGGALCLTALLLAFAYFFRTKADSPAMRQGGYRAHDISFFDAFIMGCAQSIAVIPGLSRSGSTIATGIMLGDKREAVARFSFFMVIIPILGEALLDIKDLLSSEGTAAAQQAIGWLPLLIGFVSSFIVGCIACKWMLEIVKKGKLVWFALYCIIVGIICLVY